MKLATIIAFLALLASCSEREEKLIDFSERIPKSERDYDAKDTNSQLVKDDYRLEKFRDWNPSITAWRSLSEKTFLERFRPDTSENLIWYLDTGDSVIYNRIVFQDSVKTKSAFYNWLDHKEVSYFGAQERIQKDPLAIVFGDTVIITLSGDVDFNYWENFFMENKWIHEGDYWITQRKYGKALWRILKDKELEEIKKQ